LAIVLSRPATCGKLYDGRRISAMCTLRSIRLAIVCDLAVVLAPRLALPQSPGASAGDKYHFVAKWGSQAPPGTLNDPDGMAIDASGNVFVADQNNNRIEKFDATGKFLLQWGKLGNQNGEFWGQWL